MQQALRDFAYARLRSRGTAGALAPVMEKRQRDSWAIPCEVILWTTYGVGLIMVMVVVLMH